MSDNPYQQPPYVEKRPRYFDGQYLQVSDFLLEQQYHIDRQRRISQFLQVSGILEGLEVTTDTTKTRLIIKRGSAIDEQGRQILLSNEVMFEETLLKLQSANQFEIDLSKFPRNQSYHLWIAWDQVEADLQEAGGTEKTRFYERPKLLLQPSQNQSPAASVFLALLNSASDGFTIGTSDRRQYSGLKLPASNNNGVTLRSLNGAGDRAILTGSLSVTQNLRVDGNVTSSGTVTIQPALTATTANAILTAVHIKPTFTLNPTTLSGVKQHGLIVERGNVGIGTTNPSYALQVGDRDTINSPRLAISGRNSAGSNNHWRTWTLRTGDGSTSQDIHKLRIRDEDASTDRLIIDQDGNVGIGTASPSARLEIQRTGTGSAAFDFLSIYNDRTDSNTQENRIVWKYRANTTSSPEVRAAIASRPNSALTAGDLRFQTGSSLSDRMIITDTGNVGIGTTTPSTKLQVEGGALSVTNKDSSNNTWGLQIEAGSQPAASSKIGVSQIKATATGTGTGIQNIELLPKGTGMGLQYQAGQVIVGKNEVDGRANLTVNGRASIAALHSPILRSILLTPLDRTTSNRQWEHSSSSQDWQNVITGQLDLETDAYATFIANGHARVDEIADACDIAIFIDNAFAIDVGPGDLPYGTGISHSKTWVPIQTLASNHLRGGKKYEVALKMRARHSKGKVYLSGPLMIILLTGGT